MLAGTALLFALAGYGGSDSGGASTESLQEDVALSGGLSAGGKSLSFSAKLVDGFKVCLVGRT